MLFSIDYDHGSEISLYLVPDTGGQNDPSSYTVYLRTAGGTAYARIEVSP